jgi:SPP1 gp7 family putative phage head morphogenesis protein
VSQILFGPVPHTEASDFIKDKPAVSRAVFEQMLPEVRARTFLVSGLVPLDIAQKLRDRIADIPDGGDWDKAKRDIADSLSPFFQPDVAAKNAEGNLMSDSERQAAAQAAAERRSELLLRTHGYQAYSAAQYNVLERQKDVFPFWRYQTAQDDRVRDSHAALEGVVLPANDPFWQTHFPPWDFNCRCTVVPLSDADVAEISQEDKSKPPEERSILDEQQRSRMNTDGTLLRGPNEIVDVRSPRQKRDSDGYAWQPGDLRLPLSTLKERYSPEVFSAFEEFAKNTTLEDGRSIHDWLAGAPAQAPAPSPIPSVPSVVSTPSPEPVPARSAPVSSAFGITKRSKAQPVLWRALAAIDRVHDDGTLPQMTFTGRPSRGNLGHFKRDSREIAVSASGPWRQMTATHEVGHMLDWFAITVPGRFASEVAEELAAWREAVAASSAVKQLESGSVNGRPIYKRDYFLITRELWARSYAQYIAHKSGDIELLRQLDIIRNVPDLGSLIQWSESDFAPIAAAIDDLFKKKGWIA